MRIAERQLQPHDAKQNRSLLHKEGTAPRPIVRVSQIISALSYALDLTEGRPMGHSVRSCMIGMRLAAEIGLSDAEQSDLYYALLLKDAGCSSNASKLFHILSADEIRAKRDVKLTDWTRVGWESLHYALTHVATGAPFLERVSTLVRVAAKQQTESCELVKIRCERGASIARRIGFPEPVAQAYSQPGRTLERRRIPRRTAPRRNPSVCPHHEPVPNSGGFPGQSRRGSGD